MTNNTFTTAQNLNSDFMDLYGSSLSEFVTLSHDASLNDIKKVALTNIQSNYEHNIMIGDKKIIAMFKYTWKGNVAKTSYLHVYHVNQFEKNNSFKVLAHWKEQKNGEYISL
jgi:hypothetical protein